MNTSITKLIWIERKKFGGGGGGGGGGSKYIKQLENKFYEFLWNNKPDKVKHINITQNYQKGGLKMITLEYFVKAMYLD